MDGWRAVAIIGVLVAHDLPHRIGRFSDASFKGYGGFGVYLFFAISGILICTRLLEDEKKMGRLDLKGFYTRRLFRIQPALLCYLFAAGLLILLGISHDRWTKWFGALFLVINFQHRIDVFNPGEAFIGHFWTLAVEEHFYILLSLLFWLIRKRRVTMFGLLLLLMIPLQLFLSRHFFTLGVSERRTYWQIQYLLVPAFAAMLLREQRYQKLAARFLKPWGAFVITFVIINLQYFPQYSSRHIQHALVDVQSVYFCFTLWVIATMLHPTSMATRLLELAPLRYIGRLSYSLYLWHILFFIPTDPGAFVTSPGLLFLAGRPWRYLCTAGAAMASYYLVERPMIRIGHRIAPPATPGHRDLAVTGSGRVK